jgi:hypothetical protein
MELLMVQSAVLLGVMLGGPLGIALGVYLVKRPGALCASSARAHSARRSSARAQCAGRRACKANHTVV